MLDLDLVNEVTEWTIEGAVGRDAIPRCSLRSGTVSELACLTSAFLRNTSPPPSPPPSLPALAAALTFTALDRFAREQRLASAPVDPHQDLWVMRPIGRQRIERSPRPQRAAARGTRRALGQSMGRRRCEEVFLTWVTAGTGSGSGSGLAQGWPRVWLQLRCSAPALGSAGVVVGRAAAR